MPFLCVLGEGLSGLALGLPWVREPLRLFASCSRLERGD
jgi:hypothetical protein